MMKKLQVLGISAIMLFGVFGLSGCNENANKYTEAEHVQRVTERIQKRYIDGNEKLRPYDKPTDDGTIYPKVKATDFAVFPLYNENNILKHFLVEFQPFGYLFVRLRDERLKGFSWLGASTSMYTLSSVEGEPAWSSQSFQSPYIDYNIENKLYLLNFGGYIPAIKQNGEFKNLISNSKFEIINGQVTSSQSTIEIAFINKKHFDL